MNDIYKTGIAYYFCETCGHIYDREFINIVYIITDCPLCDSRATGILTEIEKHE